MTDVREMIQSTLDAALVGTNVYVFWQRRVEILSTPNPDEYVIYTLGGDYDREFADNEPLIKEQDITIKYYYRSEKTETSAGRTLIKSRENTILNSLKAAGFYSPSGFFDVGDIDDIGYFTSVSEWSFARVV